MALTSKSLTAMVFAAWGALQSNPTAAQEISDALPITEYPARYLYNSLIELEVDKVNIRWGSKFALRVSVEHAEQFFQSNGKEKVFGAITDRAKQQKQPGWTNGSLGRGEFVVEFVFTAKQDRAAVKVDGIRVYVDAYRPLPEITSGSGEVPLGGLLGRFYYTIISPPPEGHRSYFTARYLPDPGHELEGIPLLAPGMPELFTVKIDASKPGYYMVGADVLLSQGSELQRYNLGSWEHVIYFE